jgi:hypothetical protein
VSFCIALDGQVHALTFQVGRGSQAVQHLRAQETWFFLVFPVAWVAFVQSVSIPPVKEDEFVKGLDRVLKGRLGLGLWYRRDDTVWSWS